MCGRGVKGAGRSEGAVRRGVNRAQAAHSAEDPDFLLFLQADGGTAAAASQVSPSGPHCPSSLSLFAGSPRGIGHAPAHLGARLGSSQEQAGGPHLLSLHWFLGS